MDKNIFNEALYASCPDVVVCRRKSVVLPIVTLVTGVALLVVNSFIDNGGDSNNLKSSLVLLGGIIALVGVIVTLVRLFGRGEPYHKATRQFLSYDSYNFGHEQREKVLKAVKEADVESLKKLPQSEVASIAVMAYTSTGGEFVAMQPFAYEELEYRPICDVKIVQR